MTSSTWHDGNQAVLMAAIETIHLRLLDEPDAGAKVKWRETESALDSPSALHALVQTFQLTAFEEQIIVLCAGMALDARIGVACAQSSRDVGLPYPSLSLALRSLPGAHWGATAPDSALRYWRLVRPDDESQFLSSRLRLDERILHYLMGVSTFPEALTGLVHRVAQPDSLPPSQRAIAGQIVGIHENAGSGRVPILVLDGVDVQVCRQCAANAYARMGIEMLTLQAGDLPTTTHERIHLLRLLERETLLNAAALYLDAHTEDERSSSTVAAFANNFAGLLTIGAPQTPAGLRQTSIKLTIARPTSAEQVDLWQNALGPLSARLNGDVDQLVRQFDLDTSVIQATGTRLQGELAHEPADHEVQERLWQLCRVQARPQLSALAQHIESNATWKDLVLPEEQRQVLQEISIHVSQRAHVYYDWGFAAQNNRGLGISALFTGDSGTGKTLAAEVVANQLNLDLFRIDLSSVVSKYIGETEKNLARVFDAAETIGAVLLFDEADALFGKRSEVKDSHDRYANIEVSYLLQRMESYRGLAILTTNFKRNLDPAFLRRLRFIVHFPFPDVAERVRIWRRIFPIQTPTTALDHERLAQLNVTGGHIKNIAMRAAFLAVDADEPVTMGHILHAARNEYRKLEKPLTNSEIKGWAL